MVLCEAEFQCLLESSVICLKNNTITRLQSVGYPAPTLITQWWFVSMVLLSAKSWVIKVSLSLAKRTQFNNAAYYRSLQPSAGNSAHNTLHTFGYPVAICCNMLVGVPGSPNVKNMLGSQVLG